MKHIVKAPYRSEFGILWKDMIATLGQCGERIVRVRLNTVCDFLHGPCGGVQGGHLDREKSGRRRDVRVRLLDPDKYKIVNLGVGWNCPTACAVREEMSKYRHALPDHANRVLFWHCQRCTRPPCMIVVK